MNARQAKGLAAGVLLAAFAGTALAQSTGGAATSSGPQAMQQNFARMQQMMDQARGAGSWNERMGLMQAHMRLMQQQMGSMMGLMGMSMRPGQRMGNGMRGAGPGQGMGRGMMGNGNYSGNVQAEMAAMRARMREMARMMQQMIEQQQLMLQKASGGKGGG